MKLKALLFVACLLVAISLPAITPQSVFAYSTTLYPSKDNYIDKLYPTTNYGSGAALYAGMPADTYPRRGLVEFTTVGVIPAGAVITGATLSLRYNGHGSQDPVGRTILVQRMLRLTWSETGSTWNSYKSGSSWTTAGAGSSSTDYTTSGQADATVPSGYGWMAWDVLTQVQWAQTNNCNVAMRVVAQSETFGYFTSFSSREGSYSPELAITYYLPPTLNILPASSVANTTAILNGAVTNTGGSNPTVTVYWGDNNGGTTPSNWDNSSAPTSPSQPQGVASFYKNVTGLVPGTLYYFTARAVNAYGTSWASVSTFTTLDLPTISTLDASNIASTSARLNSALASDGGDDCTIKFGWGLSSESDVEDYDSFETLPGTYNTGAYPYLDVGDLLPGYTYYFRVSATNDIGTDLGDELTFETTITLSAPTNFMGYPEATSISLSWSKGIGATNTLVRYGTTAYPESTTEGTETYFGPGSTSTLASLTSGKTYYFSAWGESGGNYSANYTTFLMTTSAGATDSTTDIDVPTQPSRWFTTDYTAMSGLGFIYDAINAAVDTGQVPRATAWFWLALGLAFLAGLVGYLLLGHKLLIAMICLTVVLALEYFAQQVPFWLPLMTLILVIAFSTTHKEVSQP